MTKHPVFFDRCRLDGNFFFHDRAVQAYSSKNFIDHRVYRKDRNLYAVVAGGFPMNMKMRPKRQRKKNRRNLSQNGRPQGLIIKNFSSRNRFMKMYKNFCLIISLLFCTVLSVSAQIGIVDKDAPEKPVLMVLGSYHLGAQGNNVIKSKTVDIMAPERQKELAELIEKLKKFNPTKIAVEIDVEDDAKTQKLYEDYLAGKYELTRNESNQIGFRLARRLGHKKVYCVDWGIFPDDESYNYEKFAARHPEMGKFLKETVDKWKKEFEEESEKMLGLSILDQYILINQPARIERDHRNYFDLIRLNSGSEYAGANYLSWLYGRNMKIFANIIRITDSPKDRILVIYGAGHTKLLNQFAEESGFYKVESPLKYLQKN